MFQKITKNWFNILFLLTTFALANALEVSAAPFMVCTTGSNLIMNGDAEADQGAVGDGSDVDVPIWNPETGAFTVVRYNASGGFPTSADPGPANRGSFFFSGGETTTNSSGSQIINVADCATQIDAGNQSFSLSGFFGGFLAQNDSAQLTVTFRNAANTALGTASVGSVLAADRGGATGLLSRTTTGIVPVGTRMVEVVLQMTFIEGAAYNDGYADNLSFVLSSPTAASVTINGRVLTASGRGINRAFVSLTDAGGETRTVISNPFGFYHFAEVSAGVTYIFSVRHKHYAFAPQVLSVTEERDDINFAALP